MISQPTTLLRTGVLPVLIIMLTACAGGIRSSGDAGPERKVTAADDAARTFVFECPDGFLFTVRGGEASAWLFLENAAVNIPRVPSASGVRYSDGSTEFWGKGEEALLIVDGRTHQACRNNRRAAIWAHARLEGVDFRAVGNEPGWVLEITEGRSMVYTGDYGQSRVELATPEPEVDVQARTSVYAASTDGHSMRVELLGKGCVDSMSGERFETQVKITVDGKTYNGCGRALH